MLSVMSHLHDIRLKLIGTSFFHQFPCRFIGKVSGNQKLLSINGNHIANGAVVSCIDRNGIGGIQNLYRHIAIGEAGSCRGAFMALCTVVLGQVFHNFLHHGNTVSRLILLIVSQWQKTVVNLSRVNVVIIRMTFLLLLLKNYCKSAYMVFMRMGKEPSCYLSPSVLNVFCKVGSIGL